MQNNAIIFNIPLLLMLLCYKQTITEVNIVAAKILPVQAMITRRDFIFLVVIFVSSIVLFTPLVTNARRTYIVRTHIVHFIRCNVHFRV